MEKKDESQKGKATHKEAPMETIDHLEVSGSKSRQKIQKYRATKCR